MATASYLPIVFLVSGSSVVAAVGPENDVAEFSFQNSEAGLAAFGEWLEALHRLGDETVSDSIIVPAGTDDASIFESALFGFAFDATRNTEVWSHAKVKHLLSGAQPTARAVLAVWSPGDTP